MWLLARPGLSWIDGIDGVVNWGNGKILFFKGNKYLRYDIKIGRADQGYPKTIDHTIWPGLSWRNGISAIVVWNKGKAFFFRGNEYVRFDLHANLVDPGYPKSVNDGLWPGFALPPDDPYYGKGPVNE
jgi:hypothetical protein